MSELIGIRLLSRAIAEERARVHRLRGREEIGAGFEFQLDLATAGLEELDEAKLLEEPAEIELSRGSRVERRIFGMVSAVRFESYAVRDFVMQYRPRPRRHCPD